MDYQDTAYIDYIGGFFILYFMGGFSPLSDYSTVT
jgi:hypothetical protein